MSGQQTPSNRKRTRTQWIETLNKHHKQAKGRITPVPSSNAAKQKGSSGLGGIAKWMQLLRGSKTFTKFPYAKREDDITHLKTIQEHYKTKLNLKKSPPCKHFGHGIQPENDKYLEDSPNMLEFLEKINEKSTLDIKNKELYHNKGLLHNLYTASLFVKFQEEAENDNNVNWWNTYLEKYKNIFTGENQDKTQDNTYKYNVYRNFFKYFENEIKPNENDDTYTKFFDRVQIFMHDQTRDPLDPNTEDEKMEVKKRKYSSATSKGAVNNTTTKNIVFQPP